MVSVKDIMTKEVVSVYPETALTEVAKIIAERAFDGVPVVDKNNKLVGILTEYDLISKGSAVYLPTFQLILQNIKVYNKDKSRFQKEFNEVSMLKVKDVMNPDPLTFTGDATFEEVVTAFRDHHRVNPIPIVDKENKVIGVVSRFDVLKPLRLLLKNRPTA